MHVAAAMADDDKIWKEETQFFRWYLNISTTTMNDQPCGRFIIIYIRPNSLCTQLLTAAIVGYPHMYLYELHLSTVQFTHPCHVWYTILGDGFNGMKVGLFV